MSPQQFPQMTPWPGSGSDMVPWSAVAQQLFVRTFHATFSYKHLTPKSRSPSFVLVPFCPESLVPLFQTFLFSAVRYGVEWPSPSLSWVLFAHRLSSVKTSRYMERILSLVYRHMPCRETFTRVPFAAVVISRVTAKPSIHPTTGIIKIKSIFSRVPFWVAVWEFTAGRKKREENGERRRVRVQSKERSQIAWN